MRLGMVGTDLLHALEDASIINAAPGSHFPKLGVDHGAAVGGAEPPMLRCPCAPEPDRLPAADDLHSDPAFAGARVTAWWSPDRAAAEAMAGQVGVDRVVDRLEDLRDEVDAVLVCTWHGNEHYAQAYPFVAAGMPVFVDKPFTESVAEARELVRVARRAGGVLFSSSPWKWAPVSRAALDRLPQLGDLRMCVATGPYVDGPFFYVTHMVELAQMFLGAGAAEVACRDTGRVRTVTVVYRDGRVAVINALPQVSWIRQAVLFGRAGYVEIDVSDAQKDVGMVELIRVFLRAARDGVPPLPLEYLVEATAVMEAAIRSEQRGGVPVPVDTQVLAKQGGE